MKPFLPVYVPVGVPTFHMESAADRFYASAELLKKTDDRFICPDGILLGVDKVRSFLEDLQPDLIVFQNVTFSNAAYMTEVMHLCHCPVALWTLREPVIDGDGNPDPMTADYKVVAIARGLHHTRYALRRLKHGKQD